MSQLVNIVFIFTSISRPVKPEQLEASILLECRLSAPRWFLHLIACSWVECAKEGSFAQHMLDSEAKPCNRMVRFVIRGQQAVES